MPSASALAQAVAILLEDEQAEAKVNVDLCISLRVCDVDTTGTKPRYDTSTDEQLIEVGGTWNRRTRTWEDYESPTLFVARVPRGGDQEPAARWIAEWLRRAAIGPRGDHWKEPFEIKCSSPRNDPANPTAARKIEFRRAWSLLLEGGRRGGKSWLSCFALVAFAVTVPNALVWAVSPTQDETDELEQAMRALMPGDWYTFRGGGAGRPLQFRLANGSRILCLSGHKPRSLKRGRVDLALYNEGQNMYRAGWIQLRGAVADTGGLVIIAANPPDAEIGRWIEEVHEKARAQKIKAEWFKMTAATNPFVEVEALQDMADEVDELTYRREVLGEFVPIGDVVMHAWSDSESVKDPPARLIDVTARETKREFGRTAGYVVGMDFQKTPHMCASIYKLFLDPESEDPNEVVAWCVDEIVVEDATEDDLINALEAMPRYRHGESRELGDCYHGRAGRFQDNLARRNESYGNEPVSYDPEHPEHCAVVMDASGFWQDGEHSKTKNSDQRLRERGWIWLYRPQRESDANPNVTERCNTTNARLKSADMRDALGNVVKLGRRRMFVSPHCVRIIRAMRSWPNTKLGFPDKGSKFAHVCDATSYPIHRFFARPKPKRKGASYTPLDQFNRGREVR